MSTQTSGYSLVYLCAFLCLCPCPSFLCICPCLLWRSSFWPGDQLLSGSAHDVNDVEGVRQQEEQEDKIDEEIGDEMMERSKRSLNVRMKHEVTQRAHET